MAKILPPLTELEKSRIVNAAAKTLGLDVKILCMEKIGHAPDDPWPKYPLGMVIIAPLLLMRHLPRWWWKKRAVDRAVKAAMPDARGFQVQPISEVIYGPQVDLAKKLHDEALHGHRERPDYH